MEDKQPLNKAFDRLEDAVLKGQDLEGSAQPELEQMTRDIGSLGLFGRDEAVEELPTSSLNFLLLPAFLATLAMDSGREPPARLEGLRTARVYFRDFLERVSDYGIAPDLLPSGDVAECSEEPSTHKPAQPTIQQMNAERELKIRRLRESEELERRVSVVRERLRNGTPIDDDVMRDHLLEKIRWWVHRVTKDLDLVEKEIPMLEMLVQRMESGDAPPPAPKREAMKPIILTRDATQKAVFGAGYPSMYTMTVREYMDMTHHLHKPEASSGPKPETDEEEENMDAIRALDEYKDYHRRGWANTHNKG